LVSKKKPCQTKHAGFIDAIAPLLSATEPSQAAKLFKAVKKTGGLING